MNLSTRINDWTKLYSANTVASSITAPVPTLTEPTGDGIIEPPNPGETLNILALALYGVGANNVTGTGRITIWRKTGTGSAPLWIPTPLSAFGFTMGTSVGIAGSHVLDTERFADTIAETTEFTTEKEIVGAGTPDNTVAIFKIDTIGARKVQVQLAVGTATSVNGLWAGF